MRHITDRELEVLGMLIALVCLLLIVGCGKTCKNEGYTGKDYKQVKLVPVTAVEAKEVTFTAKKK